MNTPRLTGARHGDRVALIGAPSPEYAATVIACWAQGICVVPLNPALPLPRRSFILELCGCRKAVTFEPGVLLPAAVTVIDCSNSGTAGPGLFRPTDTPDPKLDASHDATIIMTSGSTGSPKGVVHSLDAHRCSAQGSHENIPFGADDTWLVSLPFHHVSGMSLIMRSLLNTGSLLFPDRTLTLEQTIIRGGFTHISLVPTQLVRLMRNDAAIKVMRGLKAVLLGGAACPPAVTAQGVRLRLPLHLSYGMTEMASQVTTTARLADDSDFSSSGPALPMREVRIGPDGEIQVRGRTLCRGYFAPDGLVDPRDSQGWFHTRDSGILDMNGNLKVTGRMDAMFISGGENIHPEEIEQVIAGIERVDCCIVVPRPHPEYGMRPVAFVHMVDGHLDKPVILARIASAMERFKRPDDIFPWPADIPLSSKPDRGAFTALAAIHSTHSD